MRTRNAGATRPRWTRTALAIAGAIAVAAVGAGVSQAAGGSTAGVAEVGSYVITDTALSHWLTVANDAKQPTSGVAAAPLPVPPDYTACVAAGAKAPSGAKKTPAELKKACATTYSSLVNVVMNFLVEAIWVQGEASARNVTATPAQIDTAFASERTSSVPRLVTTAELNHFLAASGETIADLKWRTLITVLADGLSAKVEKAASNVTAAQIAAYYNAHVSQFASETVAAATPQIKSTIAKQQEAAASTTFERQFTTTWRSRTACRSAYMVSSCDRQLTQSTGPLGGGTYTTHIVPPPTQAQTLIFKPTG